MRDAHRLLGSILLVLVLAGASAGCLRGVDEGRVLVHAEAAPGALPEDLLEASFLFAGVVVASAEHSRLAAPLAAFVLNDSRGPPLLLAEIVVPEGRYDRVELHMQEATFTRADGSPAELRGGNVVTAALAFRAHAGQATALDLALAVQPSGTEGYRLVITSGSGIRPG